MSDIFSTVLLIFGPLLIGWMILRIYIFFGKISGRTTLLRNLYPVTMWIGQIILIFVSLCAFLFGAFWVLVIWIFENNSGGMLHPVTWTTLSLMLYALTAFAMNLSPRKWHIKAFYPVQILLLLILLTLAVHVALFFALVLGFGAYFALWFVCIQDRKKAECTNDAPAK